MSLSQVKRLLTLSSLAQAPEQQHHHTLVSPFKDYDKFVVLHKRLEILDDVFVVQTFESVDLVQAVSSCCCIHHVEQLDLLQRDAFTYEIKDSKFRRKHTHTHTQTHSRFTEERENVCVCFVSCRASTGRELVLVVVELYLSLCASL